MMDPAWIVTGGVVLAALISAFGAICVAKLNQIHRLANSRLDELQSALAVANATIADLSKRMSGMHEGSPE